MDLNAYKSAVLDTRAKFELSVQRNEELLESHNMDQPTGSGSVAHISNLTLRDRQTGVERKESTVTLATVAIHQGKRVLTELTEVHHSAA